MSQRIAVLSEHGPYEVVIGCGGLRTVGDVIPSVTAADRFLLVVDQAVAATHGAVVQASLGQDRVAGTVEIIAEERLKQMQAVEMLWDSALAAGLDRSSAIISVGGGLTGDVAGFAAATYMRGKGLGFRV